MERTFKREIKNNLEELHEEVNGLNPDLDIEEKIEKIIDYCVFRTIEFCLSSNKDEILSSGTAQNDHLENFKKKN